MAEPSIGVLATRYARAANVRADVPGALCDAVLPLSEALAAAWDTDAHLVQYRLVDEDEDVAHARCAKRGPILRDLAEAGCRIEQTIVCLDHDLPDHREWRDADEVAGWLAALPEGAPTPTWFYSTLRGSRLVYELSEPVPTHRGEAIGREVLRRIEAALGAPLNGAAACLDWCRLFRLPRAVREDVGRSFGDDPRFVLVRLGGPLDVAGYPEGAADDVRILAPVRIDGERPALEDCEALAKPLLKAARRALRGRAAFAPCFEDGPIDVSRGWDNGVMEIVGQVCGMLASEEETSAEGVYALLRPALEQLTLADEEGGKDWEEIGWEKIKRVWALEDAKLAAARQDAAKAVERGAEIRDRVAAAVRAELPAVVPEGTDAARDWVRRRSVASDGRHHYIMRADGSYNLHAVGDSMLVPMIRDLGMTDAIPVTKISGRSVAECSATDILNSFAVPIVGVRCSARDKVAYVDGDAGSRILHVPIHRLNPRVQPAFNAEVAEWLETLFGDAAELGLDWLAHALAVSAPICALNLFGEPGSGKGMLAQGLAECFEGESPNDGRVLDRFNYGLLKSPMILCDEGVPIVKGLGSSVDQVFRALVSGGPLQIEGKMRDVITADMYPRVVFTSNDRDITRDIVGQRDLTEDDVRAIEQRLLSIQVGPDARRLLTAKGNSRYTAGWIAGAVPSRYVVAGHVRFLFETRTPSVNTTGRFLVEGETRTRLVSDMRLRSDAAQAVLRALVRMLTTAAPRAGLHVAGGCAWTTSACILDYVEATGIATGLRLTMHQISRVLRQFAVDDASLKDRPIPATIPPGAANRARWIELNLALILQESLSYGMECDRIEAILRQREGGAADVALARGVSR